MMTKITKDSTRVNNARVDRVGVSIIARLNDLVLVVVSKSKIGFPEGKRKANNGSWGCVKCSGLVFDEHGSMWQCDNINFFVVNMAIFNPKDISIKSRDVSDVKIIPIDYLRLLPRSYMTPSVRLFIEKFPHNNF